MITPFHPTSKSTVNINVSSTSQNVQVFPERGPVSVRIYNAGSAVVWINFGDSNVGAVSTSGIPIAPGMTEMYTLDNKDSGPLYVAAIAAGSTGFIYFTPGRGL